MNTDTETVPAASVNQSGRTDQSVAPAKKQAVGAKPKAARAAKTTKAQRDRCGHRGRCPRRKSWSADIAAATTSRRPSRSDATPAAAPASRSAMARRRRTRRPRALGRRKPQSSFGRRSNLDRGQGSSKGSGPDRELVAPSRLNRRINVSKLLLFMPSAWCCALQSNGRSIRRVSASRVRSTGWRPSAIASMIRGARNPSGMSRRTERPSIPSRLASSPTDRTLPDTRSSAHLRARATAFSNGRSTRLGLDPVFLAALHSLRAARKTVRFWIRGRRALHRAGQHLFCWPTGAHDGRAPLIPCRELLRRQVAETRVWAQVVVVVPPRLDDRARFPEAAEPRTR